MWPSFLWIQRSAATVDWGNRGFFLILLGHSFHLFTSGIPDDSAEVGRDASSPRAQEVVPAEPSKPPGKAPGEAEHCLITNCSRQEEQWVGAPEGPYLSELKSNVHLHKTNLSVP